MWWKLNRIFGALLGCWRIGRWIEDRLRRAIQWFKTERGIKLDLSWSNRIWALRHGFYSDRIVLRGLNDHLVCECVQQHEYARRLFPHSTNTIRFITLRDDDTLELF